MGSNRSNRVVRVNGLAGSLGMIGSRMLWESRGGG